MRRTTCIGVVLLAGVLAVSACSKSGGGNAGGQTTIEYWLWDSNQTAQYQACADDFMQANPDIKINITQTGWSDYWSNLSTNLTAGTGPDVFTDHLTYFPTFLDKQQIIDLQPYIDKDSVDMTQYFPGLADLWKDQKGDSYGLPKDWDTVAIFYNEKMITDAGYTDADLANLTWNPTDGGTYEKMIAHLTVDTNGVRGDEPGFDKNNIATYGLALEGVGAGFSQQQLAEYLFSTGWQFTDKNPWGTVYNFSDQRFKDTVSWSYSMVQAGYQNDLATALSMDGNAASGFAAGKYAMVTEGDWMISSFQAPDGSSVKFAPTPIGPTGKSTSMFNGLTDAITTSSKHPDQAWQWVKFLGSTQCQQHVADAGVVFPAIKSLSDATLKARTDQGIDVSAFMSYVDNGTTFPPPITEHFPDVVAIEQPVMENIMQGKADVSALDAANDQINALFTSGG